MQTQKHTIILTAKKIDKINQKLAQQLTQDYQHKNPVLIGLCNGAIPFLADLMRKLDFPLQIDTITTSAYDGKVKSISAVKINYQPKINLTNRHLIIIDEIIDTGKTLHKVNEYLTANYNPSSIKLCVLLDKPQERLINADYTGTQVSGFVIGYGLDYDNYYRNLPYIAIKN